MSLLAVSDLSVRYGDAVALDGVSLTVGEGEIVAIIGGNGAGKTTLIRTIAGMLVPTSGSIRFEGVEIAGRPSHAVCGLGVGQVAEGRQIFPSLSVIENLEMGSLVERARARARRNLERMLALFPRLAERRAQAAGTLSGGEQQMLAIARSLMGEPRLLMFDEPSLGLAPAMVKQVFATILTLHAEGLSILLVEQNVAQSLRLAGRAYVLETGRIAIEGSGAELMADDRVRRAYLGM